MVHLGRSCWRCGLYPDALREEGFSLDTPLAPPVYSCSPRGGGADLEHSDSGDILPIRSQAHLTLTLRSLYSLVWSVIKVVTGFPPPTTVLYGLRTQSEKQSSMD